MTIALFLLFDVLICFALALLLAQAGPADGA